MKNERMYNELIELLTTDSAAGKENAIADKLTEKIGKEKTRVKEKIRSSMQNSGKVNWYETMPDGTIVRHR